jgi:hypothetical protein
MFGREACRLVTENEDPEEQQIDQQRHKQVVVEVKKVEQRETQHNRHPLSSSSTEQIFSRKGALI